MSATTQATPSQPDAPSSGISRLWRRELPNYPTARTRITCLGIVVLTTILFYYQYYVISGVSVQVLASTGMSFLFFVNINVVSALASALTSIAGGVSDRYGRANIVTVGTLLCALVCLIGFPNAHSPWSVGVLYALLGAIEGTVLVATPALIRDFSPQMGRASAMGFWTIGPVAGSLVVSVVVSNTVDHLGAWQDQYIIAGFAGLGVFLVALLFLRELSPRLRDQVIVSERDRVLIEARARGLNPEEVEAAQRQPFRQMLHLDILGSAVAISVFLFIYFAAVGFFPVFFQTVFGFSASKANSLGNWMWGAQAIALILVGWLSDRLGVRKPFMAVGAIGAIITTILLITHTGHAGTSYYTFVAILVPLSLSLGLAFAPWMASFTETVERRNPALTATGLSLWGLTIRIVVTVSTFVLPYIVTSVTPLVQDGPAVQATVAGQVPGLTAAQNADVKTVAAAANSLTAATQDALSAHPNDPATQVKAASEVSGKSPAVVTKVSALSDSYASELATAGAIDAKTLDALGATTPPPAAITKALGEITAKLNVSPSAAVNRLVALSKVPSADLTFLQTNGPTVQKAADALTALGVVTGPSSVQSAKGGINLDAPELAALRNLVAKGPKVQKAQHDSPGQWQTYFWIAVGGQIVFIPAIFLMTGEWRPGSARRREQQHAAAVEAELAELSAAGGPDADSLS